MSRATPISLRVPGGIEAPAAARHAVRAELAGRMPEQSLDDVLLLVSELVTNGVRHAEAGLGDEIRIEITVDGTSVRVAVTDPGSRLAPEIQPADPLRPGGMGLLLVDRISSRWGVERAAERWTRVWFEVVQT